MNWILAITERMKIYPARKYIPLYIIWQREHGE